MNTLFLAAECSPFASTGGLGEVIASLPAALRALGDDCRVLLPAYSSLKLRRVTLKRWEIQFDNKPLHIALQQVETGDVPLYLLDIPSYFARENLYGYPDDILRFGAFCRAALLVLEYLQKNAWPVEVIHCHDWHTALYPVYKSTFGGGGKVLLTIHNLAYQGVCDMSFLERLGLPVSLNNWRQLEFWGQLNPFKGGLVFADAISTVSPTYAEEIQTAQYGSGLEGVLRDNRHKLTGIINGIDGNVWNPATDVHLPAIFSASQRAGKNECKEHVQQLSKLPPRDVPLFGMVSRLTQQKGVDLLLDVLPKFLQNDVQLVILGDGERTLQTALQEAAASYPDKLAVTTGKFDIALAHQIYAASDFFIMPSRFEPCGLAQMISMRYGTIPIVRATGGLADTVRDFSTNEAGNGFVFAEPTAEALLEALQRAAAHYQSATWPLLRDNAFAADFSWEKSAQRYHDLYREMTFAS